jgi:flagellar hook protein FlgE
MGILSALFAAVSGLNANGSALSVIGNNIANTGTVGFKSSRANFSDIISASLGGAASSGQVGIGVRLSGVQSNFTQGSLQTSSNALDLAVDGNGFFQVTDATGGNFYTRAGQFNIDKNGEIVNPDGFKLQGFQAVNGVITGSVTDISLSTTTSPPNPSTGITIAANLDSQSVQVGAKAKIVGVVPTATAIAAVRDSFQINLSGDGLKTISGIVPASTSLADWAAAIQSGVRALTATDPQKQAAYSDFTATAGATAITFTNGMSGADSTIAVAENGADTLMADLGITAGTTTAGGGFDISDPTNTSNFSTSLTVFDSLGIGHLTTTNFTKVGTNTWDYNVVANAAEVNVALPADVSGANARVATGRVTFTTNGELDIESATTYLNAGGTGLDFIGSAAGQVITLDFGTSKTTDGGTGLDGTTQFGSQSALVNQSQDGYGAGSLQGVSVSADGTISGRFSNGQLRTLAQLALVRFNNAQGLVRVGKNLLAEASDSGSPVVGKPDSSGLGRVLSSSLELSNVDLGEEFISLIAAQRGFQANARVVTTSDEILGELVNLKR